MKSLQLTLALLKPDIVVNDRAVAVDIYFLFYHFIIKLDFLVEILPVFFFCDSKNLTARLPKTINKTTQTGFDSGYQKSSSGEQLLFCALEKEQAHACGGQGVLQNA